MNAKIVSRITINDSASNIFNYLTDLKYARSWNPQVKRLHPVKKIVLNSTYETESSMLGINMKALNTVTKFVPDQEIQIENATGTVHYIANFTITNKSAHSQVLTCSTTVSADSNAFVFNTPLLKVLARRELKADLQALKVLVEGGTAKNQLK